jgi:hypothetical protein
VLQSRQGRTKNFSPDTAEKRHHFNPDNAGHGITSVQTRKDKNVNPWTRQSFSPDKAEQKTLIQIRQDKAEKN